MSRLPSRFPVGTKYVVEAHGSLVKRYVEFPNGRRIKLGGRKAQRCSSLEPVVSLVPDQTDADQQILPRRIFA